MEFYHQTITILYCQGITLWSINLSQHGTHGITLLFSPSGSNLKLGAQLTLPAAQSQLTTASAEQ